MKTAKLYMYSVALAAASAALASCSSDDAVADGEQGVKAITLTASNDESDVTTRTNLSYGDNTNANTKIKATWNPADVIWAYSPKTKYANKLMPQANNADSDYDSEMNFHSTGTCNYENGETLALIYSGNAEALTQGEQKEDVFTFNRNADDNKMAIIYGTGTLHYSDAGNSFSVRTYCDVINDGKFSSQKHNMTSVMPRLRMSINASTAADIETLKKLDYEITLTLTANDEDNSITGTGYPSKVSFALGTDNKKYLASGSNQWRIFTYAEQDAVTFDNALTLKYTAKGEGDANSAALWNTTSGAVDYGKGYIYIPVPAANYSAINVVVKVTNNSGSDVSFLHSGKSKRYTLSVSDTNELEWGDLDKKATIAKIYSVGGPTLISTSSSAKQAGSPKGADWTESEEF